LSSVDFEQLKIGNGFRLQLLKSVLSSLPIYYMTSFALPKWVLNRIDQIRRSFLWGRPQQQGKGISRGLIETAY
jgi:hypothetical protein